MICQHRYVIIATCLFAQIFTKVAKSSWSVCWPYIKVNDTAKMGDDCPTHYRAVYISETSKEFDRLGWTVSKRKQLDSVYYISYIVIRIGTGVLSDLYGGKQFVIMAILFGGIINLIAPFVILHMPWEVTIVARGLFGAMQAMFYPALISMLSRWMPNYQMTFLFCIALSGDPLAKYLGEITGIYFLEIVQNWHYLFCSWGALLIIYFIVCNFFMHSRPAEHHFISEKEKELIENDVGSAFPVYVPWYEILSHNPIWAITAGHVSHELNLTLLLDFWVHHFRYVVGVSTPGAMWILAVPYFSMWISTLLCGFLADYFSYKRKMIPILYLRTCLTAIGMVFPCVFALAGTYLGCKKIRVTLCFTFAMFTKGALFAGLSTNLLDITRHYSGLAAGIIVGISGTSKIIIPYLISFMCPGNSIDEWQKLLWLSFGMCILGSMFHFIWTRGERASWDFLETNDDNDK